MFSAVAEDIKCPICAGPAGFLFGFDNSQAFQCADKKCGFISLNLETWKNPYQQNDYYQQIDPSAINPRQPFILRRIDFIKPFIQKGTFAELGCGLGETSIAAANAGFNVWGVDESQNSINFLNAHYPQINWICGHLENFLGGKQPFDVIALFHVLEHIPNPRRLLPLLKSSLKPKGFLVVEVPDVEGGYSRIKAQKWGYWLDHHVNYFSMRSLKRLLEPEGFRLVHSEKQHHFSYPDGVFWKDTVKGTLANWGLNNIIRTLWQVDEA